MTNSCKTVILALLTMISAAQAAEFKAAVIDLDRVLQEYYKTKIVEGNLKRQADIYKDYAKKLSESLTKLQSEFVALRDSSQNIALSDAARESKRLAAQDKYKELAAKELELRTYNREKQAELRAEYSQTSEKQLRHTPLSPGSPSSSTNRRSPRPPCRSSLTVPNPSTSRTTSLKS